MDNKKNGTLKGVNTQPLKLQKYAQFYCPNSDDFTRPSGYYSNCCLASAILVITIMTAIILLMMILIMHGEQVLQGLAPRAGLFPALYPYLLE